MADLPINLFTIVFGVLIFGLGYFGLFCKYFLARGNFYNIPLFDKLMQSLILGTLSFILTNKLFIRVFDYTNEKELLNYVLNNPSVFLYQFIFIIFFIYSIILIQIYFKIIFSGLDKKQKS